VVVVPHPAVRKPEQYIKRIAALGGDTVEVRCGVLYLDGKAVSQDLVTDAPACEYWNAAYDDSGAETWLVRLAPLGPGARGHDPRRGHRALVVEQRARGRALEPHWYARALKGRGSAARA
jgi:hypothetical protein